jgi:ribosomal protein L11 methyltransferase
VDYIEVSLSFEEEVFSEILEAELAEIDFESFVNEKKLLKAYITDDKFNQEALDDILASYSESITNSSIVKIEHTNWNAIWESSYDPVLIDDQIYVKAPFHPDHPSAEITITLDPNMSFGTGHHPTTHMMLKELSVLDLQGKRVCDFGCGSGILSIYASIKGASGIGIEIDAHAAEAARVNHQHNHSQNFEIITGDISSLRTALFDIIAANINRNVIEESIHQFKAVLNPGSRLLCAGFLDDDAPGLAKKLTEAGFSIIRKDQKDGWTMLSTQRNL